MTEKIKFKAANPPRIMKYDHFAHSALYCCVNLSVVNLKLSSSGQDPGQVKVRCRSSEGQEGQSQVK